MTGVSPSYIATAYVQLTPPITQATLPGEQSLDQRNPWIALGLYDLANAAIITVQQSMTADVLTNGGYSDSFTATLSAASPLVTFEVTGATEAQATSTANLLVDHFTQSVKNLQLEYVVKQADLVTPRRLDLGTNIKLSNSRMKRALVAVIGVGLLLTIAFTIGLDSLSRRMARRRLDTGVNIPPVSPAVPQVPAYVESQPPLPRYENGAGSRLDPVRPTSYPPALALAEGPAGSVTTPPVAPQMTEFTASGPTVTLTVPAEFRHDDNRPGDDQSNLDSTVVLPLTHRFTRKRDGEDEGSKPR
jgi:hypothetical protein